ncbi:MAG: NAD(P)/FAD-dependent oxidoreductase [bacterium]
MIKYDLIVIGGGAAGMMSAGRAAEAGLTVLLLEKNNSPGVKLLATGRERCNLTNRVSAREMVNAFGPKGKFLFSALSRFDAESAIEFFVSRGVKIKVENNNRVFPQSDRAQDVLSALLGYLREGGVEVAFGAAVKKIVAKNGAVEKIILEDGREFFADKFIIAVGGKSYPATGSTGDGYKWLGGLGHTIIKPLPALAPIIAKEKFVKDLEGLTITGARFIVMKKNKKLTEQSGDAIFTANGLSGPAVLALSGAISRNLPGIKLIIDFLPDANLSAVDIKLQKILKENGSRQIKNALSTFLPERLVLILLRLAKINPEKKSGETERGERVALGKLIKEFYLEIMGVADFDKAMMTSGGVDLKEVNPKTMRSKIIKNLFFAGEILDLDGPTGGFNLQMCWATAVAAATKED